MAKIILSGPQDSQKPIDVFSVFNAKLDSESSWTYRPAVVIKKYKKHGIEIMEVAVSFRFGQPAPIYRFIFDSKNWISESHSESPIGYYSDHR